MPDRQDFKRHDGQRNRRGAGGSLGQRIEQPVDVTDAAYRKRAEHSSNPEESCRKQIESSSGERHRVGAALGLSSAETFDSPLRQAECTPVCSFAGRRAAQPRCSAAPSGIGWLTTASRAFHSPSRNLSICASQSFKFLQ